jgi:thiol-disulfide isomerase/thioredoxin
MKTSLFLCLAALTASALSAAMPPRPPLLAPGNMAPDFTAYGPDNKPVKLSDFKGKYVLIDFWATWCGPCVVTMPHMEKLHQKLGPKGLVVLGVCVWDTQAKFDGWLKSPQVKTSYLKVFERANTSNSIAQKLYSVSGIPAFFLIDQEGKIVFAGGGANPQTAAALDNALAKLGLKI